MSNAALSHVTVLDLSRILAGPWAGQVLADFGADVIKIERPKGGDDTRGWGPPFLRDAEGRETPKADAAYYLCANRNKKSVTVDFTTPEGRSIVQGLARDADVVLENFKAGGLKTYGLDYESLKAINPRLIYCSITGFGQTGPYAARPGYDFLLQAMGGLMSITGRGAGEVGAGPQKAGVAVTDILTGLYAVIGILAALTHRERTGVGQYIDLSLLDVQVACLANQAMNYLVSGDVPQRLGNAHPNIVPYQDFPTSDGFMIIAVGNDTQFTRLCGEMEVDALARDPRYATNKNRVVNRVALVERLCEVTRTRPTAHWIAALENAGVPCGPINSIDAVFADPQVRARAMQVELPHPVSGTVSLVANPLRLSETPASYRTAPPILGAQTREVLMERLGMSAEQIDRLSADGII
ncbi:MAG TPA: CaiB/BaiF CoA-transferase family protein [Steroidobacteraceae bacterium]|nr:CaiB/BaiF CoA-transferase family protein [Steroidobacteraceae bacterium]